MQGLCRAEAHHGFDSVAPLGVGDGPVNLLEVIKLHQAVERELPASYSVIILGIKD